MFNIDMSTLTPVGEFGSHAWCEACAGYGVQILAAANLPADLSWAFSETYTHPPGRLVSDQRPLSGYHLMVQNGRVRGGDGVPETCLAIPGFHAKFSWAFLCNQSRSLYGSAGQKQRSQEEKRVLDDMAEWLGGPADVGSVPNPVWPQPIIDALSVGVEEGAGLHNIAATLQSPSPEFAKMPTTELGVPEFSRMSDAQKAGFVALCGIKGGVK